MSDPLFSVENKVVVLTGAGGLVGSAIAREFAQRQAQLVLVDWEQGLLDRVAQSLAAPAKTIVCDVSKTESVEAMVADALAAHGRIEVLINCHQYKPKGFLEAEAETFPEELWDAIMDVNLKGTFLTCRAIGTQMLKQGNGSIINFASTYGVVSSNPSLYVGNSLGNPIAYSASKGGVIMMTRYLGVYWAKRGVRVNCVTPHGVFNQHEKGFIERFSAMSPMGRLMNTEEVVGAVLFLASGASSYATASNLLIEGGWTAW